MPLLLIVSCIWAAAFGLIKTQLKGVAPDLVNGVRLLLALAVFAPFLRRRGVGLRRGLELAAVGAVQFGAMYALYTRAFASLKAHEVVIATFTTPLYVTLVEDLLALRVRGRFLGCAALAAIGTAIALGAWRARDASLQGLILVQASNVCFAVGQVWYRRVMARSPGLADRNAFAWCALGAGVLALALAVPSVAASGVPRLTPGQMTTLAYLGVVSSGLCFFMWNAGGRRVNTGVLAVMNDLKIPLGVAVSLLVFGEQAAWPRVLAGGVMLLAAWWLAARAGRPAGTAQAGAGEAVNLG